MLEQFRNATILRSDWDRLHIGIQRVGQHLRWNIVDAVEDGAKVITLRDLALDGGMDDVVVTEPPQEVPLDERLPTLQQWLEAGYPEERYAEFVRASEQQPPQQPPPPPPLDDDQWDGDEPPTVP